jgi:hypothetical protein
LAAARAARISGEMPEVLSLAKFMGVLRVPDEGRW